MEHLKLISWHYIVSSFDAHWQVLKPTLGQLSGEIDLPSQLDPTNIYLVLSRHNFRSVSEPSNIEGTQPTSSTQGYTY